MSKHFLALEIPDTYNPKILVVRDNSEYSTELAVQCQNLEVFIPGFNNPAQLDFSSAWSNNLSACALGIQSEDCGDYQADLPDGIYTIRYSVSPNDKVYVEYEHLRATGVLNMYFQALGNIALSPCAPSDEVLSQLRELELIKSFIDVAKIRVEEQHRAKEGIDMLIYAKNRLDKLLNKKCC